MTREDILPYADKFEAYVNKFVTPISYDKGGDHGVLCGTGAFVSKEDRIYLITNVHVISGLEKISEEKKSLVVPQCLFKGGEEYVPITVPFKKSDIAVDVAMADITDIWRSQKLNDRNAIAIERFRSTEKIEGEYFYTVGYPSFNARMEGDTLESPIQRFLTTEGELPLIEGREFLPYCHFALKYSPEHCYYTRKEMHLCLDPRGLSGSLVWNTHLTDEVIMNHQEWSPESMTVAGVEFFWDEQNVLVCSKSEAIDFKNLM